jgi:hypothetical protein
MYHFAAGDWIDLIRGGLAEPKITFMQAHLDKGCEECQKSVATWRTIVQVLSREQGYRPPDHAVVAAKSTPLPQRSYGLLTELAQFSRLVFDSFKQPLPAMVRIAAQPGRQLVHEAHPYTIDIRVEIDSVRKRTYLTGQILNSEDPDASTSRLEVALLSGEELLDKTVTNASGEFHFDYKTATDIKVLINARTTRLIGIDLSNLET